MTASARRRWTLVAQAAGLVVVAWFLGRQVVRSWDAIRTMPLAWSWGPLLLASGMTAAMYLMLVATWESSLAWWDARLGWRDAARIWFASNLVRFVPGGVWQFAGIAAMAARRGCSAIAANGAVVLQQLSIVVAGVALTLWTAPDLLGPAVQRIIPSGLAPAAGTLVLLAYVVAFPRSSQTLASRAERLAGPLWWPAPPTHKFATQVLLMVVMWIVYGVAFWLFGRALFGAEGPGLTTSVATYTAAYVAGIVAVIAPGGLGVREAALTAALTPVIGGDRAVVMALASRLWLLLVELVTAGAVLLFVRPSPAPVPAEA